MPKLFTSSVAMLVVLFCQITIFLLAPDALGQPGSSQIDRTRADETKQLSMLGANMPVLAPSKRVNLGRLTKAQPTESGALVSIRGTSLQSLGYTSFNCDRFVSIAPVRTKHWLLNCALLL